MLKRLGLTLLFTKEQGEIRELSWLGQNHTVSQKKAPVHFLEDLLYLNKVNKVHEAIALIQARQPKLRFQFGSVHCQL